MTKDERAHLSRVAALGCLACAQDGHLDTPAAIHHVRAGHRRRNHFEVIPLCPTHHQHGGPGVAVHAGRKSFEARYGTEDALLAQVREMLNVL